MRHPLSRRFRPLLPAACLLLTGCLGAAAAIPEEEVAAFDRPSRCVIPDSVSDSSDRSGNKDTLAAKP